MNVAFAGGGTGGHIYPALAIADGLQESARRTGSALEIVFFGNADRLEATLVPRSGNRLRCVTSGPLPRRLSPALLRTVATNLAGVAVSLRALRAFRPDVLVATGGYVCFPVVLAARLLRVFGLSKVRIALFEPNVQPGLTNRVIAPLVDEIWGAFAETAAAFRSRKCFVVTGVPMRAGLRDDGDRATARTSLGLAPDRTTVLVTGGSQGARKLNDTVLSMLGQRIAPQGQTLLVSGESDFARLDPGGSTEDLHVVPYIHDMGIAYTAADVAVTRAGALTLAELAATATPAVLVPYPYAAESHQTRNAQYLAQRGAAIVIEERDLSAESLAAALASVLEPSRQAAMRAAARALAAHDPLARVLARLRALAARG